MTKEALKLALEALEEAWYHVGTFQPTEKAIDLYDEARTAIKEALANEALEKMAENARELGLDYEPPQRTWVGLTRTELIRCGVLPFGMSYQLYEAIEAKLKAKNETN